MGRVINAGDADFEAVTKSDEWVIVDFWAPAGGPATLSPPMLELGAGQREVTAPKANTDVNPLSAGKFGIRGIPDLLLFHNGELIDRQTGAMPKPMFDQWLNRYMS